MSAPFAKLSVGRPGLGAAHASYITRMSALDPDRRERQQDELGRGGTLDTGGLGRSAVETIGEEDLDERALGGQLSAAGEADRDDDPIWTWNTPDYITGDSYGPSSIEVEGREASGKPEQAGRGLTLKEKIENARTYFASHEEFEKAKGGRTHYRVVLSFDVPATNKQIKTLTNDFLGQTFPKAMAFAAIHRDTDHPHVHIYIHSRQIDGRKIQLTNDQFRAIDEKWSRIYSEFAGDRSLYVEHMRKK